MEDDGKREESREGSEGRRWLLAVIVLLALLVVVLLLLFIFWPREEYLYHRAPKYRRKHLAKFGAHRP